jgi:hypothetical protein
VQKNFSNFFDDAESHEWFSRLHRGRDVINVDHAMVKSDCWSFIGSAMIDA